MPNPIDRAGNPLAVGDPVIIRGHVAALNADGVQVDVECDEQDYPNTTFETVTVSGRAVVRD